MKYIGRKRRNITWGICIVFALVWWGISGNPETMNSWLAASFVIYAMKD